MTITRQPVAEAHRVSHTAKLFGTHFPLLLEPFLYATAERLSSDYTGGYWDFYKLSNSGFYMAPSGDTPYPICCDNGFEGQLSPDALGITACLYAYSHLSFSDDNGLAQTCAQLYHLLREYMMDHPEAPAILSATD